MTGQALLNKVTEILDGEVIDNDTFLTLANSAKAKREAERPWNFLVKEDSTNTATSATLYTTTFSLPSRFQYATTLFVGDSLVEYGEIPFSERRLWKDVSSRFYVDMSGGTFSVTGTVSTSSILYLQYLEYTADYTIDDDFTGWQERFQPLLAFDVAAMYRGGVDFDDVNSGMSNVNLAMALELYNAMKHWDNQLKNRSMKGRRRRQDFKNHPDISF